MQQNRYLKPDYQKLLDYLVVKSIIDVNKSVDIYSLLTDNTTKETLGLENSVIIDALRHLEGIDTIAVNRINTETCDMYINILTAINYISPEGVMKYFEKNEDGNFVEPIIREQCEKEEGIASKVTLAELAIKSIIAKNASYNVELEQNEEWYKSNRTPRSIIELTRLQKIYNRKKVDLKSKRAEDIQHTLSALVKPNLD